MIHRLSLLLTFVLVCCAAAQSQTEPNPRAQTALAAPPGRTLTLREAEAIALKNNPQISIGKLQALAAQQGVRETRSALLPTAYLSVTAVDSHDGSRIEQSDYF